MSIAIIALLAAITIVLIAIYKRAGAGIQRLTGIFNRSGELMATAEEIQSSLQSAEDTIGVMSGVIEEIGKDVTDLVSKLGTSGGIPQVDAEAIRTKADAVASKLTAITAALQDIEAQHTPDEPAGELNETTEEVPADETIEFV